MGVTLIRQPIVETVATDVLALTCFAEAHGRLELNHPQEAVQ